MRVVSPLALFAVLAIAGCGATQAARVHEPAIVPLQKGPPPKQGLLVERARDTLLVTLDGKPYARLIGFRPSWAGGNTAEAVAFRQLADVAPERTLLVGPRNAWYELDTAHAQLHRVRAPRLMLAGHVEVVARAHELRGEPGSVEVKVSVERAGRPLLPRSSNVVLVLGDVVATRSTALDVTTGAQWSLSGGCVPAGSRLGELFALCGAPFGKGPPRLVAIAPTGHRSLLASFPRPLYAVKAALSPNGKYLLAGLAPGCGPSFSFVLPVSGGTARPVTGERSWSWKIPTSTPLGWTADNRIVASIRSIGDCSADPKAGVYVIDPRTLARSYAYPATAWAMWHSGS